ncbi:BZ3500_MvSof-1268-A1-R1_Chr8-1g09827 [Microbotryum saponariae]|uniref:Replication factor C subunit 2 n=1 Tax=Microbotryum saponariae TaxID=289078 RepID=A0A2X0M7J4_9BASI|nr:BZ3500_MvSof-1268-A1-R1_Chr8-1g09827 [Microbotryum saponariae]SDA08113.1 BZ3501_MvSof-1269-A2-R1_Chr8-1g09550 [Microbotryum saponariae]
MSSEAPAPKKDAFAMMRAASLNKTKPAPTSSSAEAAPAPAPAPAAASTSTSSTTTTAPPFPSKPAKAKTSTASIFSGGGMGGGPKHVVDPKDQPWVEKYRPKNLSEVSAQDHTVAVLKKALGSSNLPHMLFYGPPGTGKTSTILALCRQLFGPELFRSRVLELNASDERGISVVRDKIKAFAKTTVTTNHDPNYPAPPFKIIILDEADSMTQDAQSALRRIMEAHSKITRFCLICNYVTRIIEPITSRCSKFRFKPLDTSSTEMRLRSICVAEGIECPDEALGALIKTSDGDLRRAITYLQSASRLHGASGTELDSLSVQEIGGVVPDRVMRDLGKALGVTFEDEDEAMQVEDNYGTKGQSAFGVVRKAVEKVTREGYSATQVLSQLHDLVILNPLVDPKAKAKIAIVLGETDKCLTDGADEELQLLSCAARIRNAIVA